MGPLVDVVARARARRDADALACATVAKLDDDVREVAGALEARIPDLATRIVERIRAEVLELREFDSAQLWQTLHDQSRSALTTELSHLKHARSVPTTPPPDASEAARLAAFARVPPSTLLQTHRIGHAVVWDAYVEEVERLAPPPDSRRGLLDAGSGFFFAYADALARFVDAEYERELARLRQSTEKQKLRSIMDLLYGTAHDATEIGYDIAQEHLGVVAWGSTVAPTLNALAQLLDRTVLMVQATDHATWAWLGSRSPLDGDGLRELARFDPGDCSMALGEPAVGVEGFRRTHVQAHEAHRVGLRRGQRVTRYADVSLESLALVDERLARHFVALQLEPLGDDDRGRTLRQTLRAYFACEQNAAATAAALGVHEQTVAQRLRAVEERTGAPVNARRAELETALRVEDLLSSSDR